MSNKGSLKEMLGTKLGSKKSDKVISKIGYAYNNGIRGEKLTLYLKEVFEEEGISIGNQSVTPLLYVKNVNT